MKNTGSRGDGLKHQSNSFGSRGPQGRLFLAGAGGVPFAIYNKWKENARNDSGRAPEERRMSEDERG